MIQEHNQSSTLQNPLSRGKILLKRAATAFVLLSALLPFANNLLKLFIDSEKIIFSNTSGVRPLDLDTCVFFLSIPLSLLFVTLGALMRAHKLSYIAIFISIYIQFVFLIKFIFLDQNDLYFYAHIGLFLIFTAIVVIIFFVERYLKKLAIADAFKEKTLDRLSSIISREK